MLTLELGQRVAFARTFLKNTGQQVGEAGFLRGTITDIRPFNPKDTSCPPIVTVEWSDGATYKAVPSALWDADKLHLEDR